MMMRNWIPYDIKQEHEAMAVKWLWLGEQRYLEPFFEDTVRICRRLPENKGQEHLTDLSALNASANELVSIKPTAFIFHISRCGSTLMTQLLSLREKHIVVSEAPILDAILRWKYNDASVTEALRHQCLMDCVHVLGQRRFAEEGNYFIKWDSWHLFFLDEIRELYPTTPFVFMVREIDKVMDSHQKIPGMQSVRGLIEPGIFGLTLAEALVMQPMVYLGHILHKMMDATHRFMLKDNNSLLLSYEDGMFANFEKMLAYLNMNYGQAALEQVSERLRYHSKRPKEEFEPAAT